MEVRTERDEEDADDSEPVAPMTLKEAREMIVKGKKFCRKIRPMLPFKSILLLLKDWFEPWRPCHFLPDHAKLTSVPF
jgi:hypothetical protein